MRSGPTCVGPLAKLPKLSEADGAAAAVWGEAGVGGGTARNAVTEGIGSCGVCRAASADKCAAAPIPDVAAG